MEKTFAIIKPDAVATGKTGDILKRIEADGLTVSSIKMMHLDNKKAEGFYFVHKGKPFFNTLMSFMTSGPVVLLVLSGENVIAKWRKLMGATNPANADAGTIRKDFASSIEKNCVHGSDSPESAAFEISYFFSGSEIYDINKENVFNSGSK